MFSLVHIKIYAIHSKNDRKFNYILHKTDKRLKNKEKSLQITLESLVDEK